MVYFFGPEFSHVVIVTRVYEVYAVCRIRIDYLFYASGTILIAVTIGAVQSATIQMDEIRIIGEGLFLIYAREIHYDDRLVHVRFYLFPDN